jgi:outer membrane autotransporter protein
VAVGADATLSPRAVLGGVFAYTRQTLTGSEDAVPNRLAIDSYQAGLYGSYAFGDGVLLDGQLDGALNDNAENRTLAFINGSTGAGYRSYGGHAGAGIRKLVPIEPGFVLAPSLRLDYGQVRSPAYQESGAGGFSLNVDSKTWRELTVTAGLKGAYQLTQQVFLTGDVGVGYNMLNEGLQIKAAFAGGGDAFITNGLGLSPWIYSAALGVVAAPSDRFDLGVRYGVQATSSGLLQQSGLAVLKMRL